MDTFAYGFNLPAALNATTPPERRGLRRDLVKLMVLHKKTGITEHTTFHRIEHYLRKGDLLVLNASRTVPAILKANLMREGHLLAAELEIRLAHQKSERVWEALVLKEGVKTGDIVQFSSILEAEVVVLSADNPFKLLQFNLQGTKLLEQIYLLGQPVRYEYIQEPWELDYYQTVFASVPGSVEMPSAGRAFSWELLFRLQRKGIRIAYLHLHTGLSYLMDDQWHQEPVNNFEQYNVPMETVKLVHETKAAEGRVIAVGTTVVRSLETAVDALGQLQAQSGWTNLFIHNSFRLNVVDGLITGLHEPKTSHLELLSAFVSPELLIKGYEEAIEKGYLWHEFGDMNLIL
jgi:S-adenosylmethionine:tRNA ribosyltransferase-isomerase